MTQKAFQKFDSNQLMTQNAFSNFDSNRLMTKKYGILIRINSWLNYTIDSVAYLPLDFTSYDLFWAFDQSVLSWCDLFRDVWPFLGIRLKCLPENWFESTHDLRSLSRFNSWLKWLFMELTENQLTIQADPKVLIQIDSWLKRLSRYLTQNQLIAQADPQVLNQFDSSLKQKKTIDSESTHDSTLSRTHVWYEHYALLKKCLWWYTLLRSLNITIDLSWYKNNQPFYLELNGEFSGERIISLRLFF